MLIMSVRHRCVIRVVEKVKHLTDMLQAVVLWYPDGASQSRSGEICVDTGHSNKPV